MSNGKTMSVVEACEYVTREYDLPTSRTTLYNWINRGLTGVGKLKTIRLAGKLRIKKEDLDAFILHTD